MKAISDSLNVCYGLLALFTLGVGAAAFFMFLAGLVIGGATATSLAVTARDWMMFAIKTASLATLFGLVDIYLKGSHSLTIDQN
ncbi:MAG: hypothetical protein HPY55_01855 [Firmicutes bacterium]|nr:hypothetical protein [Bacillota bacterium]